MPEQLHETEHWPAAREPVLVVNLEGWIDGSFAASAAMAHLLSVVESTVVARFDAEALVDYRARRPVMHLVEGVNTGLTWPTIELRHGHDLDGRDLLLLTGAEPDVRWNQFAEEVVDLAAGLGTRMVIGLGAYPAAVPHTRPSRLATSASTPSLARSPVGSPVEVEVAAGMQAIIESGCAARGIPSVGLWAQTPNYVTGMVVPGGGLALLEGVEELAEVRIDLDALREADEAVRARLDRLVADNPEHVAMVRQLEAAWDEAARTQADVPSGAELASEIERWLRQVRPDDGGMQ